LVQRKIKRLEHPEAEEETIKSNFESVYEGEALSGVFDRAVSKLSAKGYEILGTEQIISSILETPDSELVNTINKFGLNTENFEAKLSEQQSRQSEYEGKKIIFSGTIWRWIDIESPSIHNTGFNIVVFSDVYFVE
jgi:ATP-dependent Clp protease ATP-binding subunit ClpA